MTIEQTFIRIADALERIADTMQQTPSAKAVPAEATPDRDTVTKPAPKSRAKKTAPAVPDMIEEAPAAPVVNVELPVTPAPATAGVTLDTIKQKLADLTQDNPDIIGRIREVLSTFGVARVSELAVTDYDEFLFKVEGA